MENYDPIEEQYNNIQSSKKKDYQNKKKVVFDVKNYLNVKLNSKESSKKLNIRILNLTPDSETPFAEIHTHYLPSKKSSFVCGKLTKNTPEGAEKNCPFCDIREEAKKAQIGAGKEEWNKLKEIYNQNAPTLNYVVRLIDRDDEAFGIKFWKFGQSVYDDIYEIYQNNKADGINIFDNDNGKDLIVTIKKKENKDKISNISAANRQTPINEDEDVKNSLITDTKVWSDVYGIKPYEYLELVIDGKEPFFDKTLDKPKWVEKKEKVEDTTEQEIEDEYDESEGESYESTSKNGEDLPF
jgi:hypothetical protein